MSYLTNRNIINIILRHTSKYDNVILTYRCRYTVSSFITTDDIEYDIYFKNRAVKEIEQNIYCNFYSKLASLYEKYINYHID